MKENQKKHGKLKALKIVMENVYSMGIFPQTSFNEFRKENMYFLTHLNIRQQKFEFRYYGFYEGCRRIKLKVTSEEVRDFLKSDECTDSGTII